MEKDLISRQQALKDYQDVCNGIACSECKARKFDTCLLEDWIKCLPHEEIQKKRKTGKWINLNATDRYKRVKVYDHFECSVCHERSSNDSKFCPNCGSYNGGDEE